MNEALLTQFTKEDIVNAVKSMAPLKAPGVDSFPAIFFQRYWHIIEADMSLYCLSVLNGETEIGEINKTHIVLIPKVQKPKNLSQFKPISLCNVVYKIIAKVLVIRMSAILGNCINEAQGAFIPGRLILDNVFIAYEVLHSFKIKKRGKKGNFALKLDMNKAYDHVEWDFLAGMMKQLGFHADWIVHIMRCVCSVSYSVSLNIACGEWFSPSRGLRQGDPLSPYLFLICAKGFSTFIKKAEQKGLMKGAPIGRESTRKLIANGILWRVSNGARINIWDDPWLPRRGNDRVSVQKIVPNWTSVNQLIEHGTSTWNKKLIHTIVDDATAARLFSIPLAGSNSEDLLFGNLKAQRNIHLWYRRNKLTHEGVKLSLQEVLGFIKGYKQELRVTQEYHSLSSRFMTREIWRPPGIEVIRINFDTAFQGSVRLAITATLAKDSTGEIIGAKTYLFANVVDTFVAEARACERALIFAGSMSFQRLIVKGDSLTVIKSTYRFVPRMANEVAHMLALESRRSQRFGVWIDGVPDATKARAMKDSLEWN
ncbi:hypothetical protein PVK06_019026 [Gossypium arboreum]|uniref:Reverse transcriptase n=1 Tax=Gossypium arboreum TaxID=29729 RepID=A0ABR0PIL1_GOSAR|nr:hypothetical protein PVK06_019026 [Gossypium arboreum]